MFMVILLFFLIHFYANFIISLRIYFVKKTKTFIMGKPKQKHLSKETAPSAKNLLNPANNRYFYY